MYAHLCLCLMLHHSIPIGAKEITCFHHSIIFLFFEDLRWGGEKKKERIMMRWSIDWNDQCDIPSVPQWNGHSSSVWSLCINNDLLLLLYALLLLLLQSTSYNSTKHQIIKIDMETKYTMMSVYRMLLRISQHNELQYKQKDLSYLAKSEVHKSKKHIIIIHAVHEDLDNIVIQYTKNVCPLVGSCIQYKLYHKWKGLN